MKKTITLVALLFCTLSAVSQIVNIPDANFKAKLLAASSSNTTAKDLSGNYFKIDANNDGEIQISEALTVSFINVSCSFCNDKIASMEGVQAFINLEYLYCNENLITSLNINNLNKLKILSCSKNYLLAGDFNFENFVSLQSLICFQNKINSINLKGCKNLNVLQCYSNQLTTLNLEDCIILTQLITYGNNLQSLNIKNGKLQSTLNFNDNPDLKYICCDAFELSTVDANIIQYGYTNCYVNTYCSFVPGGTYYTIKGNLKWDTNNNGCDANDINYSNMKFNLSNGSINTGFIENVSGNYSIPVVTGTHTLTPILENPTYFTVSPPSFQTTFTSTSVVTSVTQNFCIAPNGVHQDLEVVIVPVTPARPGFEATYTIVYKNKGNVVIPSGQVAMEYLPNLQTFVSAVPAVASTNTGFLYWNYTNLQPFETRTITVKLKNNKPTDTPPLVGGDLLQFIVKITPEVSDYCSQYTTQTVVNSFDPNDKTLLEGKTITPAMIGKYVHYVIRFENTGTAPAQNIVVKDIIDTTKFDVSTLIPMHSSHDYITRISDTNKVEFIFEGINLPFNDANNDGYIMFKIKLNDNLTVGNTFSNLASIYFDYNKPIITNTETTSIVAPLTNPSFDFETNISLYPNPTKSTLNISTKNTINLNSIEIYNTIGQIILSIPNTENQRTIDVSTLTQGTYFIKVHTDKGTSSAKFVVAH